jgi:hypothetical protein
MLTFQSASYLGTTLPQNDCYTIQILVDALWAPSFIRGFCPVLGLYECKRFSLTRMGRQGLCCITAMGISQQVGPAGYTAHVCVRMGSLCGHLVCSDSVNQVPASCFLQAQERVALQAFTTTNWSSMKCHFLRLVQGSTILARSTVSRARWSSDSAVSGVVTG